MEDPSPEVSKAAAPMSKSDVKKFAKTKHDKLPEKKETKESFAIDPKEHRKNQRLAKIRNLAKKGATEGERSAAERKKVQKCLVKHIMAVKSRGKRMKEKKQHMKNS